MSEEKVTPLPHVRGTPKRMRPRTVILTYYITALLALLHVGLGLYLYYQSGVLGDPFTQLTIQPATLNSIIQVFSGIFALISAFGLRGLQYWGALSTAVFGLFEYWNAVSLAEIIQIGFSISLGIILSAQTAGVVMLFFQGLGVVLIILGGISLWGVRGHRRVAAQVRA